MAKPFFDYVLRLAVDHDERDAFVANPQSRGAAAGLTPDQTQALIDMDEGKIGGQLIAEQPNLAGSVQVVPGTISFILGLTIAPKNRDGS